MMKKKVLCLVLAAAMTIGASTVAFAEEFTGVIENTDIFHKIKKLLGL